MAGIISPSMPVWVVENATGGNRAYCNVNEGLGKVLRFGANSREVLDRLRWLGTEFFETVQIAVRGLSDTSLKPLMAQALHMGDEVHNRNAAASALLFKRLTLSLLRSNLDGGAVERALGFIAGNDHFFLNLSMAACKSMTDAAHGVPGSSMVTVMSRNGVTFGIRLSGTGDSGSRLRQIRSTASTFRGTASRMPRRISATRQLQRLMGWAGSRWRPRLPSFSSSAGPGGCHGEQPANAVDYPRAQPGLHAAGTQFRWDARRHRCPACSGLGNPADHQYRDRA